MAPLCLLAGAPGAGKTTLLPHLVERAGGVVVMNMDDPGELAPGARWAEPARWALLDCPDDERIRRLRARGGPAEWIGGALADAAEGRELIPKVFGTGGGEPAAGVAERILAWAREQAG
ncbi:hypothetical protein GCM10009733_066080 [Nonomuraea maheshkhaliensis]|uniref:UDP-N-acetylglucosamine kinase n=2 Tax=Nonomuraea maheshkhaliensis TaxID=419590 RepID=A0ABN2FTC7_9ACTN